MIETLHGLTKDKYVVQRLVDLGFTGEALRHVAGTANLRSSTLEGDDMAILTELLVQWTTKRIEQTTSWEDNLKTSKATTDREVLTMMDEARSSVAGTLDRGRDPQLAALKRLHIRDFRRWVEGQVKSLVRTLAAKNPLDPSEASLLSSGRILLVSADSINEVLSLATPANLYPEARKYKRSIHLHIVSATATRGGA